MYKVLILPFNNVDKFKVIDSKVIDQLFIDRIATEICLLIEENIIPLDAFAESFSLQIHHLQTDASVPFSFYRDILESISNLTVDA